MAGNASEHRALSEKGGLHMTKISIPAQGAEKEKLDAPRNKQLIGSAERTEIDLDDSLDDSVPACHPPSMTQPMPPPETEVGSPSRKPE
jgi:hypothetical protein